MHGSEHEEPSSISFGKQLIDTFKPSSVLVEDGPLQVVEQAEFRCPDTGFIYPESYSLTDELYGDVCNEFVRRSIEENNSAYVVDEKQGMVMKRFEDGIE